MGAIIKTDALASIQYLRAIAAIMVVIFHSCYCVPFMSSMVDTVYWMRSGVDIFFVISGYVMVTSTAGKNHDPWPFFQRRIIRIVPIYWVATAAMIAAGPPVSWWQIFSSLFFIPADNPDSGMIQPIVTVGWTLNYEMFFYALFAIGLLLHENRRLAFMAAILGALVVAGFFAPRTTAVAFYTSPILVEFLFGMAIAHFRPRGHWLLMPLGLAALMLYPGNPGIWRPAIYGIPAIAIVIGALSVEGRLPHWKPALFLGDASYAIYLFHLMTLGIIAITWRDLDFDTIWFLPVAVAIQVGIGCLIHRTVEKPVGALFRQESRWLRLAVPGKDEWFRRRPTA